MLLGDLQDVVNWQKAKTKKLKWEKQLEQSQILVISKTADIVMDGHLYVCDLQVKHSQEVDVLKKKIENMKCMLMCVVLCVIVGVICLTFKWNKCIS